jgi:CrcB protein
MAVGLADNRGDSANSPYLTGRSRMPEHRPDVDPEVTGEDTAASRSGLRRFLAERGDILAVIALGGALGSLARWGMAEAIPHARGEFATSTLVTNIVGAFLLGVLMVLVLEVWPPTRLVRPFFGVGVLGGFTTFSTYALDTTEMLRAGAPGAAAAYLFTTLAAGLVASWLGLTLTRALVERRHARRLAAQASRRGRTSR